MKAAKKKKNTKWIAQESDRANR